MILIPKIGNGFAQLPPTGNCLVRRSPQLDWAQTERTMMYYDIKRGNIAGYSGRKHQHNGSILDGVSDKADACSFVVVGKFRDFVHTVCNLCE
jgi:hypothetical protein